MPSKRLSCTLNKDTAAQLVFIVTKGDKALVEVLGLSWQLHNMCRSFRKDEWANLQGPYPRQTNPPVIYPVNLFLMGAILEKSKSPLNHCIFENKQIYLLVLLLHMLNNASKP